MSATVSAHEVTPEEVDLRPDIDNPGILYSNYRGSDAINRMEADWMEQIQNEGPDIYNPGILYSNYRGSDAIERMNADRQPDAATELAQMWADL